MLLSYSSYKAASVSRESQRVDKARHGNFKLELNFAKTLLKLPHSDESITWSRCDQVGIDERGNRANPIGDSCRWLSVCTFLLGDRLLLANIPDAQRSVVTAWEKCFFVDVSHAIDASRVTVVHQLRFIDNLPDAKGSISATRRQRSLLVQGIHWSYLILVTEPTKQFVSFSMLKSNQCFYELTASQRKPSHRVTRPWPSDPRCMRTFDEFLCGRLSQWQLPDGHRMCESFSRSLDRRCESCGFCRWPLRTWNPNWERGTLWKNPMRCSRSVVSRWCSIWEPCQSCCHWTAHCCHPRDTGRWWAGSVICVSVSRSVVLLRLWCSQPDTSWAFRCFPSNLTSTSCSHARLHRRSFGFLQDTSLLIGVFWRRAFQCLHRRRCLDVTCDFRRFPRFHCRALRHDFLSSEQVFWHSKTTRNIH